MEVVLRRVERHFGRRRVLAIEEGRFPSGAWVGLRGANGAGKSTLLHILAGIDKGHSGIVLYDDAPFSPRIATRVTCVFQEPLLLRRPVRENVELPLRLRGMAPREREIRVEGILDDLGLRPWSRHEPHELSRGWRQRVAVARALVFTPELLLLDEALAPLDTESRAIVCSQVRALQQRSRMTVVSVSHAEGRWENPDLELVLDCARLWRKEEYESHCPERSSIPPL